MGAYVNPNGCSKEIWLSKNATYLGKTAPKWKDVKPNHFPICLVNNGCFTAGAIAFSERELCEFSNPSDTRPKQWYICDIDQLHLVSPELKDYIK